MVKIKMFMIVLLYSGSLITVAQSLSYPVGARAIAAGHTSVSRQDDFWAIFNNQAGAADIGHIQAGVFFENRYLVPELSHIAIGACFPVKRGSMFFSLDHFGGSIYNETKTGAGYAISFGEKMHAGIQLDYLHMAIGDGYGNYHAVTFEGGLMAIPSDRLSIGMHVFNPLHLQWINTTEHIPVMVRGGIAFHAQGSLTISAEVHKSTDNPAMFCAGAEYSLHERFYIRAGITSGPSRYTFGAGIELNKLVIDISSSIHEWLGYSPQLSVTYGSGR